MKRITLFVLLASVSMVMLAQATDLVVDNQNPGWLSNVISFGDQKTVKNLKVTGYVNDTDLNFVGGLMSNRSLNGRLDLSEVEFINESGDYPDNYIFGKDIFNLASQKKTVKLQVLILPDALTYCNITSNRHLLVDTLFCNMKYLHSGFGVDNVTNLFLGEKVSYIDCFCAYQGTIKLSNSVKYISDNAFWGSESSVDMNDAKNLSYLGNHAFYNAPDSLIIPSSMTVFDINSFRKYQDGVHIFISDETTFIKTSSNGSSAMNSDFAGIVNVHMESKLPPQMQAGFPRETTTVFVPVGAKNAYENTDGWKRYTIVEENYPIEDINRYNSLSILQSDQGSVSIQVEKGSVQTFAIQPESGWKIHSVTFNNADVTGELDATNHYTTPTITENSTLFVTFEEDTATDVKATEASDVRVQGTSFGVRILNAANETANIYTPDGVLVKAVKVAGAQMDIELPEGSIYLVKIADKTVKVSR